jgi:hypothetical protein
VLFWCVVLFVVAAGLYWIAPWILPVRVVEGPMVQQAGPDGVTLVWFTSRPAATTLAVEVDGQTRTFPSPPAGRRHRVRVDGLAPGQLYNYRILAGPRTLVERVAFQTNKPADHRFTFLVFGDSGRASRVQFRLAGEMARLKPVPDLLVHTGDMVYPDGARVRYPDRFFAPYRELLARVAFWPCLGNHDVTKDGRAEAYAEVFDVPTNGPAGATPRHNYWFDYASARFVVIDSNFETASDALLGQTIAPWVVQTFSAPGPRWRFVVLHHPPFSAGKYAPDERLQRTLVPAFEQVGVDVVFCGHDHNYQRFQPLRGGVATPAEEGGVVYVVTGAGGARLYDLRPRDQRPPTLAFAADQLHSFTQATIEDDTLTLRQFAVDTPRPIDEFTLTQRRDATPPPTSHPALTEPATTQPAAP